MRTWLLALILLGITTALAQDITGGLNNPTRAVISGAGSGGGLNNATGVISGGGGGGGSTQIPLPIGMP
jgi:hypothetical protein